MKEFLQRWYEEKGIGWCAKQLGKSYGSVTQTAHTMGLSYRKAKQERIRIHLSERLLVDGWKKVETDLGLSEGKAYLWAKKLGIDGPPDGRGAKPTELSDDQRKAILEQYPLKSTNVLAGLTGLTNDIVIGFLQRNGRYVGFDRRVDTVIDKSRFEWSNDLAYVLGYMYADGSVGEYPKSDCDGRTDRRLTYSSISSKDEHILWDIRARMGWKAKPCSFVRDTGERYWQIATSCRWVFDKWAKLGLKPRKSFDGMEIPNVPVEYIRHFVRGFFDGDGSKRKDGYVVKFGCTDELFMLWLRNIVIEVVGGKVFKMTVEQNATTFYSFVVCADRAKVLLDWMMPGVSDLRLHRKWDEKIG
jgi:transposase